MKFIFSPEFKRGYKRLPRNIKERVNKQLRLLKKDFRHPSLRVKKVRGVSNIWEARVSKGYRMLFSPGKDKIFMLSVGSHDKGLGKK